MRKPDVSHDFAHEGAPGPLPPVNPGRLLERIEALAKMGATEQGGVGRLAGTDADRLGRDLLVAWMRALDLRVDVDRIGNIFGTLEGRGQAPALMIGSHIDSVANGGKLDGAYGVLAGLEIASACRDASIVPERALVVAAFTNEEGARFAPDMMGSLVFAGGLDVEAARATQDAKGTLIGDELDRIGYSGTMPAGAERPGCFLELHIEQGPVLESEGTTLGAVEGVQGIHWTELTIEGQANHAGTTPMRMRKDAGLAAARVAVAAREIASRFAPTLVATVGALELTPGLVNVVSSRARLTVDLRDGDRNRLEQAQEALDAIIEQIARDEGVAIEARPLVRFAPVDFDSSLVALIEDTAQASGHSIRRMISGAGHDAQMLARVCPSAMIFVPSIAGISHNPREATAEGDLTAGLLALNQVASKLLFKS